MLKHLFRRYYFLRASNNYTNTADYRIYRNRLALEKYKKEISREKKGEKKARVNVLTKKLKKNKYIIKKL